MLESKRPGASPAACTSTTLHNHPTMATRPSWDYILKFIIIGDASVGKSSLLVRLTEDRFLVDSDATIGIEFGSHIVTLESGERLKLQVWDTAGSEQFRSVRTYI